MGLISKIKALGKTTVESSTDGAVNVLGYTALGTVLGIATKGITEIAKGVYQGDILSQIGQAVYNSIPIFTNGQYINMDILKEDLVYGIVGASVMGLAGLVRRVKSNVSGTYQQIKSEEDQAETVRKQAKSQVYSARVSADAQKRIHDINKDAEKYINDGTSVA